MMSNPFEFRELMKAAFRFGEETVQEVQERHKQRHAEAAPGKKEIVAGEAKPKKAEMDKLAELIANAKRHPTPTVDEGDPETPSDVG